MSKPALGRGLGALLGTPPAKAPAAPVLPAPLPPVEGPPGEAVQRVALSRIRPCPFQPRKSFGEEALRELADSIKERGIVQPLIVRARADTFELIAGERRWRAARLLGLGEVPVIVREADDRTVLELALIENLQRENLNPIEEAQGYSQLIQQFQLTQEEAAAKVGKGRVVVANSLRLLKLDPEVQAHVRDGRLSVGHAKVVLGLTEPAGQRIAAERILKKSLTVRQTEDLVAQLQNPAARPAGSRVAGAVASDPHLSRLQGRLQERLGTKVELRYRAGKGALQIHFFNDDDLERVLEILGVKPD
jgi:ParB family transcriptional regulator, chromosome partitioning protein